MKPRGCPVLTAPSFGAVRAGLRLRHDSPSRRVKQGLNNDIILAILGDIMAKVTSKLQLTLPKAIADQYKIRPGDELDWLPAGETMRVVKRSRSASRRADAATLQQRLRLFEQATARQEKRNDAFRKKHALGAQPSNRGWRREDLYDRGLPR
jgi:bifunctional DNA-binding transcriptional regulator/antitoxin component of YhaV-PrlF toxin-antitoxin module